MFYFCLCWGLSRGLTLHLNCLNCTNFVFSHIISTLFGKTALTQNNEKIKMQDLIQSLSLKTTQTEFSTSGFGKRPAGLDKLSHLKHFNRVEIHFLYAMYLDERHSMLNLRAHLAGRAELQLPDELRHHQLKIINGALRAFHSNGYREVMCYKCKGKGCERCANTGKTAKKPKEYQVCNFDRSTWYNKNNALVREKYSAIVDYLFQISSDINKKWNILKYSKE